MVSKHVMGWHMMGWHMMATMAEERITTALQLAFWAQLPTPDLLGHS